MLKNCRKIFLGVCFLLFLGIAFFCLPNNTYANLEVTYPKVGEKTLTATTKFPDYITYLLSAGMLIGFSVVFISLAIAGVMYFLSPAFPSLLSRAKDRVSGAITGLLILLLAYTIIITINPELNVFKLDKLTEVEITAVQKKSPGVYFYQSGCLNDKAQPHTSNVPDLGDLKNKVNSVGLVQDTDNQIYYLTLLYNEPNFAICQYATTTDSNNLSPCFTLNPFEGGGAISASIYKYDFNPTGKGVYFYRKSYFDSSGGSFFVPNSAIKNFYVKKLDDLTFNGVPKPEQNCVKHDDKGVCAQDGKEPPSLTGENISSVKIDGKYIVLFTYAGPGQDCSATPWTSCQEFPTYDDVNKTGPQQIKWENIRNEGGVVPNCVIIFPVQSY